MLMNPFAVKVYRDIAKNYSNVGESEKADAFLDLSNEIFNEYSSTDNFNAGTESNKDFEKS